MEDFPVRGMKVFRPLLLNVNERPLPPAEPEMLQPRKLKEILLCVGYPIRVQVTPSGRRASSTVTV